MNTIKNAIDQSQTNLHDQLSMSRKTQGLNRSKPKQWARSAINVNMNKIKHVIDQSQTNVRDQQ